MLFALTHAGAPRGHRFSDTPVPSYDFADPEREPPEEPFISESVSYDGVADPYESYVPVVPPETVETEVIADHR